MKLNFDRILSASTMPSNHSFAWLMPRGREERLFPFLVSPPPTSLRIIIWMKSLHCPVLFPGGLRFDEKGISLATGANATNHNRLAT